MTVNDTEVLAKVCARRITVDATDHAVPVDPTDALQVYIPLARMILSRAETSESGRFMVGISGPPGAGKTVTAAVLSACLEELGAHPVVVPLDGFHYPNAYLQSHRGTDHEGKPRRLSEIKGWHTTFDAHRALAALTDLKNGRAARLPVYSRSLHDPVESALAVEESHSIVLFEGNYLFMPFEPWDSMFSLFDLTLFVTAPREVLVAQIRERHIRGGRSAARADEKIATVDGPNMDAVLTVSSRAEYVIEGARGSVSLKRNAP